MERDSGAPCSMTVTITNEEQPESMGKVAEVCKYLFSPCSITAYPFCKIVIKGLCSSKSFKLFLFFFSLFMFACTVSGLDFVIFKF